MKLSKVVKGVTSVGGTVAAFATTAIDAVDRIIHYKEYKKREKRRKIRNIILISCGIVLAILFIPYKVKIKPNGEYEIRTLLLNISRKNRTDIPAIDEEDGFDISEVDDVAVAAEE